MTKEIKLSGGRVALVDEKWFEFLSRWKWFSAIDESTGNYYAIRNDYKGNGHNTVLRMHRIIMDTPKGKICDHINHNTLDNREENLRNATPGESNSNRRKHCNNKSGYKGVTLQHGKHWKATVDKNGEHVFCKTFPTALDAAMAYDREARKYHGEFAVTNFPEEQDGV